MAKPMSEARRNELVMDADWRASRHLMRGTDSRERAAAARARGDIAGAERHEATALAHDQRAVKWIDRSNELRGNGGWPR